VNQCLPQRTHRDKFFGAHREITPAKLSIAVNQQQDIGLIQ